MTHFLLEARRAALRSGDLGGLYQRVPYIGFLGMQLEQDHDAPRFRLPFSDRLIGNSALPALHGGVIAAFMENAALLHLLLVLDEARVPKSIDFSIDYLRSGNPSDLLAECEVARQGRRVAQVQIRCWQADADRERTVALARAHFLLSAPADDDG